MARQLSHAVLKKSKRKLRQEAREARRAGDEEGAAEALAKARTIEAVMDAAPRRECVVCGRAFTPEITVSGRSTQVHCSPECAAEALRKRGLLPPVDPARAAQKEADREARRERLRASGDRLRAVRGGREEGGPRADDVLGSPDGIDRTTEARKARASLYAVGEAVAYDGKRGAHAAEVLGYRRQGSLRLRLADGSEMWCSPFSVAKAKAAGEERPKRKAKEADAEEPKEAKKARVKKGGKR